MRFLMFYVNDTSNTKVPLGILYIITLLKERGHAVSVFDNSIYGQEKDLNDHDIRGSHLNFQLLDLKPYGVTYDKVTSEYIEAQVKHHLEAFRPDMIGISITEDTSRSGFWFATLCKKFLPHVPVIMGGVFCSTRPDVVISHEAVDIVCVGEGEHAAVTLVDRMEKGQPIDDIPNLWIKKPDGRVIKNPVGPPGDLNGLPFPDLSMVDDRHLYAPFAGHVYKMTYVESQRGCPRRCTYCCNQVFLNTYKDHIKHYLRRKRVPRLIDEIVHLKDRYGLNFIQFTDDDFLLRPEEELAEFSRLYKERVGLPFWIQAEAWHATDEKVRWVREAGCLSISMGVETGSTYILEHIMKRKTPREKTIEAFRIMHKYDIRTSANVIIGVPEETRESIFDTVELIRECEPRSINTAIFIPYYGLELREYAVQKNYLDRNYHRDLKDSWRAVLTMPHISNEEIENLARTFVLYSTLPKADWGDIEKVEKRPEQQGDLKEALERKFWGIMLRRGINVDVPGFDYQGFLKTRQKELSLVHQARV